MLAGLWAAVLIPATMRSRDHAHDGRSIEGFHTAMRTLSRRTGPDTRRIVVPAPHVTAEVPGVPSLARRKTVFSRALATAIATFVLAVVTGGVSWVLHLAADVALGGVVVWLRRAATAEAEHARRARRERQAERDHREAAELAAYRASRAQRLAYDEISHRRAVND